MASTDKSDDVNLYGIIFNTMIGFMIALLLICVLVQIFRCRRSGTTSRTRLANRQPVQIVVHQPRSSTRVENIDRPLSEEELLNILRAKKRHEMVPDDLKKDTCSICLDEFQLETNLIILTCKHVFHEECITAWLKQHGNCPTCRNSVRD